MAIVHGCFDFVKPTYLRLDRTDSQPPFARSDGAAAPNVDEGMTVDAEIKVVGLGIYE